MSRSCRSILTAAALAALPVTPSWAQAPAQSPAAKQTAATQPAAAAQETFVVDRVHSEASFQIRHFVTKVRGRFADFEGTLQLDRARPEASAVEFRIKATSIDTANERRDNHLRSPDFFDVATHPEILFRSSKVLARGQDRYDVTGTLTMRGVAKEITLPVTFLGFARDNRGTEKAGFETTITLNRKEFGILWNQTLDAGGMVLGDDVQVIVNIEANKKAPAATAN